MMIQCGVSPLEINPMLGPYPDALSYWGGILHLVCNIAVQLESGAFFEREWGSGVWFVIYITSAVGSSILSTCAMPNSISVGSSGAVMGLFGGKLAEVFCRAYESRNTKQGRIGHED
eukprot:5042069-Ditylum_brightwellii.AAC.1